MGRAAVPFGLPDPRLIAPLASLAMTASHPGRRKDRKSGALTVALLGMPNTGKSTLYNRLTGGNAQIANWPGLTVQRFLRHTPPDLLLVVLNATQISSQLRLLLQLKALAIPTVVALNMSDEARHFGITIDTGGLAESPGLPVLAVSARRNQGMHKLIGRVHQPWVEGLLARHVQLPPRLINRRTRLADRVLLDPLLGLLLFLGIVLALFQLLFAVGAPAQDLMGNGIDWIQTAILEPVLAALNAPPFLRDFLVDGVWLGVGTVATFLPIIFLFYLVLAVVEDSGYLPRAAFLMDGFMRWIGLDGRAFVLQVIGFGCNVPSILGTRVIRDRGMRLLSMLVIPFALCQARLTVFLFMAAVFFPKPWWAPGLVVFGFYVLSFVAVVITGLLFKRAYPSQEAFVLELPPYRTPSLSTILRRGWTQTLNFLATTRTFIVLGAAAIWLLTNLPLGAVQGNGASIADGIGRLFQPLLAPIGMNPALTVSLFFGVIAKEILLGAMAVIYKTSETDLAGVIDSLITPLQSLSFMTFVLLYTPCLGTVAAQLQESKSRSLALVVFQGGRLLGFGL